MRSRDPRLPLVELIPEPAKDKGEHEGCKLEVLGGDRILGPRVAHPTLSVTLLLAFYHGVESEPMRSTQEVQEGAQMDHERGKSKAHFSLQTRARQEKGRKQVTADERCRHRACYYHCW
jgi:hypothetical protein